MVTDKGRKNEIMLLNVLFCTLVVLIHVFSYAIASADTSSWQYAAIFFPWRFSAFVVQGFVFLSGLKLFLKSDENKDWKAFFKRRFFKIIVPYLVWNCVYYAYFIAFGYYAFSITDFLRHILLGTLISPFYYIIIIAQFYLLTPVSRKISEKVHPLLRIVTSLLITLFMWQYLPQLVPGFEYNDRIFTTYLVYWVMGSCAGQYYEEFKRMLTQNRAYITIAFVAAAAAEGFVSFVNYTGRGYIPGGNLTSLIYCIAAIAFLYSMALRLTEKRSLPSPVRLADRYSYTIYLSHLIIIFAVNHLISIIGINRIGLALAIRFAAVYLLIFAMCLFLSKLRKSAVSVRDKT
jgi:peptidoglycan/LPS O-acetylase OafA/YrhL